MSNRLWLILVGTLGLFASGFLLGAFVWPYLSHAHYRYYTVQGIPIREDLKTGCTWILLGTWELHNDNPLHCFGLEEFFVWTRRDLPETQDGSGNISDDIAEIFKKSKPISIPSPPGIPESDLNLPVVLPEEFPVELTTGEGWLTKRSEGLLQADFKIFNPSERCIIKGVAVHVRIPGVYDEYLFLTATDHKPRTFQTYSGYLDVAHQTLPSWKEIKWDWDITHLKVRRRIGDSCL